MMIQENNSGDTPRKILPNPIFAGAGAENPDISSQLSDSPEADIMKTFIIEPRVYRKLLREEVFRYLSITEPCHNTLHRYISG